MLSRFNAWDGSGPATGRDYLLSKCTAKGIRGCVDHWAEEGRCGLGVGDLLLNAEFQAVGGG